MISYGQYVKFNTLNKTEVYDFINLKEVKLFSNKPNYRSLVTRLTTYKDEHLSNYKPRGDKRAYTNIYAYSFDILLDNHITKSNCHEFVKLFVETFDYRFKNLLYVYYFDEVASSSYLHILMFSRKTLDKQVLLTYTSDYYQDKDMKVRRNKNHPNAVLLHKKGDAVLDTDGNEQYVHIYVKNTEEKIFKFTNFRCFIDSIKKIIMFALQHEIVNRIFFKAISKITLKEQDSILLKQKKLIKNRMIWRINANLSDIQEAMLYGYMNDDNTVTNFNKIIHKINFLIKSNEWKHGNVYINTSYKQNFMNFKNNLIDLENYIEILLNDWRTTNFLPYIF